jgi:hypothetical protein
MVKLDLHVESIFFLILCSGFLEGIHIIKHSMSHSSTVDSFTFYLFMFCLE